MRVFILLLIAFALGYAEPELLIRDYFSRKGKILSISPQGIILNLDKTKVREGEEFLVQRSKATVGKVAITLPQDNFSVAKLVEGSVREGDEVILFSPEVCFEGSDDWFFRIGAQVSNIKRGKADCVYKVKELKTGIGVEFRGSPSAFFAFQRQIQRAGVEELNLMMRPKLLKSLPSLPVFAEVCNFNQRELLLILYQNKLEAYELTQKDLVKRAEYSLPAGVGVMLACGRFSNKDLVFVSMVSADSASSVVLEFVGETFIFRIRDFPYLVRVLDRKKPEQTLIAQRLRRGVLGPPVRLAVDELSINERGTFEAPPGFRIDSAFYFGNTLVFVDALGRVRVFSGSGEIFSSDAGFGGSYNYVEIPGDVKQTLSFTPPGTIIDVLGNEVALVIKNQSSGIQRFFDIVKFSRGELFSIVLPRPNLVNVKQVRGSAIEESIQAILTTSDGRIIVVSGKVGALGISSSGEIYEVELKLF
ncbi:MAG: hypothetical protein NZL90_00680 [Aquificaceae bacterium]|nr:hypothetical protein [Aquificaceae bacterium]MDW8236918.1 hypothetical protein [Aquificaceae bacterium]